MGCPFPCDRGLLLEVRRVDLDVLLPLLGHVGLGEDGGHGADRLARPAVDARVGVDVELLALLALGISVPRLDAVDRALLDARLVAYADARLADDVGHESSCSRLSISTRIGRAK